jgi:2-oxoisovalerate dehydrogenase E2 component (dihydrolipoyl transacylase)
MKEDVLNYIKKKDNVNTKENITKNVPKTEVKKIPQPELLKEESVLIHSTLKENDKLTKITGFQKAMTKVMTNANNIPSFLFSDEYNVDRLIKLRQDINTKYSKEFKFSYMPFIIKAVSQVLHEFPQLNSQVNNDLLSSEGYIQEYVVKNKHNIAIAIDGPDGLVVPNIKDVSSKTIKQIQSELYNLRDKTQNRSLSNEDFNDPTFTISNIGNIGGKQLGPVIMPPQVAIIGISRMIDTVKIVRKDDHEEIDNSAFNLIEGKSDLGVVFHKSMNFCISADHRVIDGAYVARFSQKLRFLIENPMNILIG